MTSQENAVDLARMSEILDISIDTLRRRAQGGYLPAFKIGHMWRFFPSKVIAHLEEQGDPWKRRATPRPYRRPER